MADDAPIRFYGRTPEMEKFARDLAEHAAGPNTPVQQLDADDLERLLRGEEAKPYLRLEANSAERHVDPNENAVAAARMSLSMFDDADVQAKAVPSTTAGGERDQADGFADVAADEMIR